MRLLELRAKNFAGLPDATYSFRLPSGAAARSALITGSPRSGKTALLEAIIACKEAIVPYGRTYKADERARVHGEPVVLETHWELDAEERSGFGSNDQVILTVGAEPSTSGKFRHFFDHYEHGSTQAKFDYFPADRFLPLFYPGRHHPRGRLQERAVRLSKDPEKYSGLWGFLADHDTRALREHSERTRAQGVSFVDDTASVHTQLREKLRLFIDEPVLDGVEVDSGELLFRSARGLKTRCNELPSSARHALLYVLSYEMVHHVRSVIFVDGIERGQNPGEHERIARALLKLGGDSQLIATTTSKELLQTGVAELTLEVG